MKNQSQQSLTPVVTSTCGNTTSLYQLVNKLQVSLLSQAANKKSFIINDIDKSLGVFAEEHALAYVIGSLLSNAVHSTSDSCIRIETATLGDRLQIRIRNNSAFVHSSYIHMPGNFVDAAKKIGGNIGLETDENSAITLVFSLARYAA
jgi:hypothetical protein